MVYSSLISIERFPSATPTNAMNTIQLDHFQRKDRQPLQRETETFRAHLDEWNRSHSGEFVLICGPTVKFFPTLDEALSVGYEQFDELPFFVKEIVSPQHVEHITPLF